MMGNHKFKLSDMLPNAWFYKLKDMSRVSRSHGRSAEHRRSRPPRSATPKTPKPSPTKQPLVPNRTSYYFPRGAETEKFPNSPLHHPDAPLPLEPPAKSNNKLLSTSISSGCSCRAWTESTTNFIVSPPSNPHCHILESWSNSSDSVSIDMEAVKSSSFDREVEKLRDFDAVSELELPPILTKSTKTDKQQRRSPAKRSPTGLRMRASSPRIAAASKKSHPHRARRSTDSIISKKTKKGFSESFAVVKRSSDPHQDFRDSMVEMIIENDIRASKDLEELLACYLTLNSNEYHDVIVKVFEQIWFDLNDIISCK